jgi:hypothetical protein
VMQHADNISWEVCFAEVIGKWQQYLENILT